jgi:hypothetical protein
VLKLLLELVQAEKKDPAKLGVPDRVTMRHLQQSHS